MKKDNKTNLEYRTFSFTEDKPVINEEKRTAEIAFSSETPVERSDGAEVLGHRQGEMDQKFIASGSAPILLEHNRQQQIGVVDSVRVEDGTGRATVRFGRSELAKEIFNDVVDGIRSNISVGYIPLERERERSGDTMTYRVTKWLPKEISVVSIPADESVGVGRSDAETITEIKTMTEKTEDKVETRSAPVAMAPVVDMDQIRSDARKDEMTRMQGIDGIAKRFNLGEAAQTYITEGKSIEQFRAYALDNIDTNPSVKVETADIGMSPKEIKRYSVMKAIRTQIDPSFAKDAGLELEASKAAAEKSGMQARGVMLPYDIMTRDLLAGTTTAGGHTIGTDLLSGSFIELLRNKMVVRQLGARVLAGLQGNVAIPSQTAGGTSYWVAENGAPTETALTVGQVTMAPKTVGAFTDLSRQLMMQSSIDIENLVVDDLATSLALAIDLAALYGTGANNQPTGINATTGINTVTNFAAAVPTFAEVITLETAVAVDNALLGNLAYLTDATTRGGLKTKAKDAGSGQFVWENNEVNGYNAQASSQVTAGDLIFGNWADLLIGFWGGLDIVRDPYTNSTTGGLRIVAFQSTDVAVRHPVSFVIGADA